MMMNGLIVIDRFAAAGGFAAAVASLLGCSALVVSAAASSVDPNIVD